MAAMLVNFYKQKNFDYFFCFWNQHGLYVYCLLCPPGIVWKRSIDYAIKNILRKESLYLLNI